MTSSPANGGGLRIFFLFLFIIQQLLFKVTCSSSYSDVLSQDAPQFLPATLVVPVVKDSSTLQYTLHLHQGTPPAAVDLTLHLGGALLWLDCGATSSSHRSVHSRSVECAAAVRHHAPLSSPTYSGPCVVRSSTAKTGRISWPSKGELAEDVVSVAAADDVGSLFTAPSFLLSCAAATSGPSSPLFHGLAAGSRGLAGLGRDHLSLPSQLAANFSMPRKFGLCLPPSSSSPGAVFFGDSEFQGAPVDLIYTPMLTNPVARHEYYVGVTSIRVNGEPVAGLNTTLLRLREDGTGGTKISTVQPYTVLETSIYRAVAGAFARESGLARVRVPRTPDAPFRHCFFSHGEAQVPPIDLVLQSKRVIWRISGDRSVVQVRPGLLCLAFVDGGRRSAASVVFGGFQLEDVFLQFDLSASRLGFSSSFRARQTGCRSFKSTAET